jgi:drug/metabolite transporter (DMT)-like permease
VLFGTVQMGMAYLLMARGLKYVSPQEAGTLTLLEPILNPLWAYLVSPEREKLTIYIVVGGICILGGWCIATDHSGR